MSPSEFYLIFNMYNYIMLSHSLPSFIHTWKTIAPVAARFRCTHTHARPSRFRLDTCLPFVVLVCRAHALIQSPNFPTLVANVTNMRNKIFWYSTQGICGCAIRSPFCVRRWLVYVYGYLRCSWSGALCLRHVYAARNQSTTVECTTKAKWHLLSQDLSLPWPFRIGVMQQMNTVARVSSHESVSALVEIAFFHSSRLRDVCTTFVI